MSPNAQACQCLLIRVSRHVQGQSVEEARARRDHLAKMRSLLFHQEAKLKHLAKIKSKDYHRRAQKAARAKVGLLAFIQAQPQQSLSSDVRQHPPLSRVPVHMRCTHKGCERPPC